MSPQVLLGLGVGLPLLAIGGYLAWLSRRVDELEERKLASNRGAETGETGD